MKTSQLFAFATLALSLAACGQMSVPTTGTGHSGTVAGQSVKIQLHASASAIRTLGLPKDAPLAAINVTLRDADGQAVYVKDGAYVKIGSTVDGATNVIQLTPDNNFFRTLVLPAGHYSFENAGKYGDALLTYGPDYENENLVDADHNVVQLKFHGVVDPMKSRLDFAMQTAHVYTGDRVNLHLTAMTASIDGLGSFPVPTSDLEADGYDTSGADREGQGSALGVSVIARGTATNPNMTVTPYVSGWVRQGTSDTATMQPLNLPAFQHSIETSAVVADLSGPYSVTLNHIDDVTVNTYVPLQGQALDEIGITGIDVYDNNTLIASSNHMYGPASIRTQSMPMAPVFTDEQGNWNADWTALTPGQHELTVVARDGAGNETRATQVVTVAPLNGGTQSDTTINLTPQRPDAGGVVYTIPGNGTYFMKINAATYPYPSLVLDVDPQSGPVSEFTATYGFTRESADLPIWNSGYYYYSEIQHTSDTYWLKIVNTTDHPVDVRPYVGLD